MNVIRPEKIEGTETEVDGNFAAASEVEAGIRDFVRNDVAYLRRPGGAQGTTEPPPVPTLEPSQEAAVNNVNSLIQRVAGNSLSEIENLISELESLRDRIKLMEKLLREVRLCRCGTMQQIAERVLKLEGPTSAPREVKRPNLRRF